MQSANTAKQTPTARVEERPPRRLPPIRRRQRLPVEGAAPGQRHNRGPSCSCSCGSPPGGTGCSGGGAHPPPPLPLPPRSWGVRRGPPRRCAEPAAAGRRKRPTPRGAGPAGRGAAHGHAHWRLRFADIHPNRMNGAMGRAAGRLVAPCVQHHAAAPHLRGCERRHVCQSESVPLASQVSGVKGRHLGIRPPFPRAKNDAAVAARQCTTNPADLCSPVTIHPLARALHCSPGRTIPPPRGAPDLRVPATGAAPGLWPPWIACRG